MIYKAPKSQKESGRKTFDRRHKFVIIRSLVLAYE